MTADALDPARVYRVDEAAALLRVGEKTLRNAIRRGEVPAIRIGRRIVLPGAALAEFLANPGGRT
ncbi:MAG: helix-turn-helix domain-containing protein [Actinomycetota bacterium]